MSPSRSSGRSMFGATWWGRAWIDALEQRARLDPNRLPRGRTYARSARVGTLTVEVGEARASVLGSRASAYRIRVRVRPFTDREWDIALDAVAARAAHAAALLEGDLSPGIVEDLAAAGIDLLPVAGEVGTSCSCPDWANPCKHAAAVCYRIADRLDEDPFDLLLLRGATRDQVLAGLRRRRAGTAGRLALNADGARHRQLDRGVPARDAYANAGAYAGAGSILARPEPPWAPLPGAHPGTPAPLATDPPAGSGLDAGELTALAADAARRAWELATGGGDGGLALDADADLARRAAAALGTPGFARLTASSGRRGAELVTLATAWTHGGLGGVSVLDERWVPPAEVLDDARGRLASHGRLRVEGNRVTIGRDVQLRYARDGRWYRCERRASGWEVVAAPDADPVVAAGA